MAIVPKNNYPGKIDTTDPNFPDGKAQNVTAPGDGTGTPWEAALLNDIFGFQQKLTDAAGIAPSGNPDSVLASDYYDALNKLFQRFVTHADTGAADAYVLAAVSGADIVAYPGGHQIIFKAANANTGASTVNVGAIGARGITLPGGTALPANAIAAGQYVLAVYDLANTRYEIINTAEASPFDDSSVNFTAGNVQQAIEALAPGASSAWVNFDGTGVVAIRAQFNVSSITDNGVGDYTINFTNAMVDKDYAVVAMSEHSGGVDNTVTTNVGIKQGVASQQYQLVGSIRIVAVSVLFAGGSGADAATMTAVIFR